MFNAVLSKIFDAKGKVVLYENYLELILDGTKEMIKYRSIIKADWCTGVGPHLDFEIGIHLKNGRKITLAYPANIIRVFGLFRLVYILNKTVRAKR